MVLLIGLVFLVVREFGQAAVSIWGFFTEPGLLQRVIELGQALGLCCLGGILFLVVMGIWFRIFPPTEMGGEDEPY